MQNILDPKSQENAVKKKRRLLCPLCGKHTLLWLLPNTEIKELPMKCKRCGSEIIVNVVPECDN